MGAGGSREPGSEATKFVAFLNRWDTGTIRGAAWNFEVKSDALKPAVG